jgi:hypothetical protein
VTRDILKRVNITLNNCTEANAGTDPQLGIFAAQQWSASHPR